LIAYASSFDQVGIFGNNVDDAALVLEVISGADEFDSTVSQSPVPSYIQKEESNKKYRIAYFERSRQSIPSLDKEIAAAIKDSINKLRDNGHTIEASEI